MARDKFHNQVRTALEKSGWTITNDPLSKKVGNFPIQIDLGAEMIIGAEKEGRKIAVEIKTFGIPSFVTAFYEAVGKFIVYREVLEIREPDRQLYLAIPNDVYKEFGNEEVVQKIFQKFSFNIILYEPSQEIIKLWIEK